MKKRLWVLLMVITFVVHLIVILTIVRVVDSYQTKKKNYHNQLVEVVEKLYQDNQLTGRIELVDISNHWIPREETIVTFDYVETVSDRKIKIPSELAFKRGETKLYYDWDSLITDNLEEMPIFERIVQSSLEQEQAVEIMKKIKKSVEKGIKLPDLTLKEVSARIQVKEDPTLDEKHIADQKQNLAEYKEQVKRNREARKPFRGYYDIDIPNYLSNGMVTIYIDFDRKVEDNDWDEEEAKRYHKELVRQMELLDVSIFPNGAYKLSFDEVRTEGGFSADILDTVDFTIQNGEMININDYTLTRNF